MEPSKADSGFIFAARVTAVTLNIRSGPGIEYDDMGQVARGDMLTVIERDGTGNWLHVRTPSGSDGWVAAWLTDLGEKIADLPLAQTIPPTPQVATQTGAIAFQSSRGGIWIMDPDGSNPRPLPDRRAYENALRPDGPEFCARSRLYCVKADWGNDLDIFVEDREYGSGWHNIVSNSNVDKDPRIHPDGWWVVFVSNRTGTDDLWLINREARQERQLTFNGRAWARHPSWSPDGAQIVFASNAMVDRRQLWILDPNLPLQVGINPYNVSNNQYEDWDPVWLK